MTGYNVLSMETVLWRECFGTTHMNRSILNFSLLPVKMSFWCWHNLPIQCLTTLKKLPKIGTGRMFHSTILWFQIVIHLRDRRRGGRKYKWMFICDTCKCPWIGGAPAAGWQFPRCLSKGILIINKFNLNVVYCLNNLLYFS
jgi:hypothetical protein